ncbi:hypothetical protein LNQ52_01550 [Klebsiella pneumoniae subsp. pneumoniae]|nr:hypothetical protein [Klebsiella pneumoniae subsp. pneumoniae]
MVQDGSVLFTASAVGSQTTLARIIRMVRQAQSSKPEIGQLADKIPPYLFRRWSSLR